MNKEIERKFLVNKIKWQALEKPKGIKCRQTYLSSDPNKIIRIRTLGEKGFITIKGKLAGITRTEFEYEIPIDDTNIMIDLFGSNIIEKLRYYINYENNLWEVDEFEGLNKGLIIAEIELDNEDDTFAIPEWLEEEVSHEMKYYNSNLHIKPYSIW